MLNSTQAFLDTLAQWVKAIRQDDFHAARECAGRLIRDGEHLAEHPVFRKCFATRCAGSDPREALFHMCQFLMCATDGRDGELKQFMTDGESRR